MIKMEQYALVKDGEILEFRNYAPNIDQKLLAEGKPKMLIVEDVIPEYDSQVQELQKEYEITEEKVVVKYNITEKSEENIKLLITEKIQLIKDEARRRIYEILLDHQQINAMASGLENIFLHGPDVTKWPKEQALKASDLLQKWGYIKNIRYKSDELEAKLLTLESTKEISAFDPLEGWE